MLTGVLSLLLCSAFSGIAFVPDEEITEENWDKITHGKSVFLMFYAPWCGHCKVDKPVWKNMMELYKDSADILLKDVDCTGVSEPLCMKYDIDSFPTYLFGSPDNLENYDGERDFQTLRDFAKDKLGPRCSYVYPDLCNPEQKTLLDGYIAMPLAELKAIIDEKDGELKRMQDEFVEYVDATQEKFSQLAIAGTNAENGMELFEESKELEELQLKLQKEIDDREIKLNGEKNLVKEGPLGLMKSVYSARKRSNPEL
eukprot:CAMPEP_0115185574 /NCGR_PEP_ID=MMETSP0270-20121206/9541_1 /TAXON_ID=71861 /ORGANISM="Scrippsiella trochoidea, Strain CCMP3099" /LENGTH=255 /DNA_ID=CAMNT_0002598681 /DNA_START=113 /DNA_END=881 /DNA_ORIENTATION=+